MTSVTSAGEPIATRAEAQRALQGVRKFGYQLQNLGVRKAAASEADLLIIDPQTDAGRLTAGDIAALQRKPDGSRRIVLAYLSVGEAEDYRPYWVESWAKRPPHWLGPENSDWPGNYEVRFWDRDWQTQILGTRRSALDMIQAVGFDGAYLDIVDGFEFWEDHGVDDARARMAAWVARIATYARAKQPGFMIVPQNGESLANEPGYIQNVDALGKEDLFFDGDDPQDESATAEAANDIVKFQLARRPVFLIEYATQAKNQKLIYALARRHHYIPLVAPRDLDKLTVTP